MSSIKPITFYNHASGPNPRKVALIFAELNIPHEIVEIADPKSPEYEKINPNGRLPAIFDPNTNTTLWESAAIVEYLIETYDKESKLTFTSGPEKWLLKQYSYFQMSGQGPYYGQATWYTFFDKTNEPAKARYVDQTLRVITVLDNILKGKTYLVGEKCTYVDLMFLPWNKTALSIGLAWGEESPAKFPDFYAWYQRLMERPSAKEVYAPKPTEPAAQ